MSGGLPALSSALQGLIYFICYRFLILRMLCLQCGEVSVFLQEILAVSPLGEEGGRLGIPCPLVTVPIPGEPDLSPGHLVQEALRYQIGGRESWEPRTMVHPFTFQEGTEGERQELGQVLGTGQPALNPSSWEIIQEDFKFPRFKKSSIWAHSSLVVLSSFWVMPDSLDLYKFYSFWHERSQGSLRNSPPDPYPHPPRASPACDPFLFCLWSC